MSLACIYQISHRDAEDLDPGFRVLDNDSAVRPDWFEYWPMRSFLLGTALEEETLYGFLSPRFRSKTNLTARAVQDFISRPGPEPDVVLLSPSLHLTAYHLNVFRYGEACHPGLARIASEFFERIGAPTDLTQLITHSLNEVYSNYFLAKPRFWRAWLEITEQLFAIAESPHDALGEQLRRTTSYRGQSTVPMKVFMLERIATFLLARERRFVVRVRDPFAARSRLYKVPGAIVCDSLKRAYDTPERRAELRELFPIVSRSCRTLSRQLRLKSFLGFRRERSCLDALAAHWAQAGEEPV
jgi:hypothetical protein